MKAKKIINVNLVVYIFSKSCHLKKHSQGYKGHKCASCGKTFHIAPYLKKHVFTVHEGDKDHKCKSCDERR